MPSSLTDALRDMRPERLRSNGLFASVPGVIAPSTSCDDILGAIRSSLRSWLKMFGRAAEPREHSCPAFWKRRTSLRVPHWEAAIPAEITLPLRRMTSVFLDRTQAHEYRLRASARVREQARSSGTPSGEEVTLRGHARMARQEKSSCLRRPPTRAARHRILR